MHKPPARPDTITPPSVPLHGSAASLPYVPADSLAQTEDGKQPPPATELAICAELAQVVQTAETRRRQAEQTTRAAAKALQARNAHD